MAAVLETKSDSELKDDVEAELKWEPRIIANEIGVSVRDGVVTLTGSVDSYIKRYSAEDAVHRVRGVKAVANDIEVRLRLASDCSDTDIAQAVVRALELDAMVNVAELDVTVAQGWVMLRGVVDWGFERDDAERVVRRLTGVKGVTNLVVVKPPAGPIDLRHRILAALRRVVHCEAAKFAVDVDGSRVTLHGTVRTFAEKRAAERAAWATPGVTALDNRIDVAN
jgi:osmotically-inducible protein OsmY